MQLSFLVVQKTKIDKLTFIIWYAAISGYNSKEWNE